MEYRHAGPLVRQMSCAIGKRFRNSETHDLSRTQCRILGYLSHMERQSPGKPVYQKDVEAEMHISKSTASQLLSSLEDQGLVRRETDPADKRLKGLVLTDTARERSQVLERQVISVEELLRRGISDEEFGRFMDTLEKMVQNLNCND